MQTHTRFNASRRHHAKLGTGVVLAASLLVLAAFAQTSWKVAVIPTVNPLPIGSCAAVRLNVLDASGKEPPRSPRGFVVTLADFDLSVSGASVVGHQVDANHWSVCACQGGDVGTTATITATYPAEALASNSLVPGVRVKETSTFSLARARGTDNPPACAASLQNVAPRDLAASKAPALVNGKFSSGLTGWIPFSTDWGPTPTQSAPFDVDGDGVETPAAALRSGFASLFFVSQSNVPQGGGIAQEIISGAGRLRIRASAATFSRHTGGYPTLAMFFDGVKVAGIDPSHGGPGPVRKQFDVEIHRVIAGMHDLRFLATGDGLAPDYPKAFIDNVTIEWLPSLPEALPLSPKQPVIRP